MATDSYYGHLPSVGSDIFQEIWEASIHSTE